MQSSYTDRFTKAFPGMRQHGGPFLCDTAIQEESSAEIPFGVMVKRGSVERTAKLVAGSSDKLFGVLQHSHAYDTTELGTVGVKPGAMLNIIRQGRCTVRTETSVVPGDRAFIRYAAGAGGSQLGAFRNAAVAGETIDATGCVEFLEAASAGGVVTVWVDMLNDPSDAT